jgi:hypothetical protein
MSPDARIRVLSWLSPSAFFSGFSASRLGTSQLKSRCAPTFAGQRGDGGAGGRALDNACHSHICLSYIWLNQMQSSTGN